MSAHLTDPLLNVIEAVVFGDVVDQCNAISIAVVPCDEGTSEPFHACSVPDLELEKTKRE